MLKEEINIHNHKERGEKYNYNQNKDNENKRNLCTNVKIELTLQNHHRDYENQVGVIISIHLQITNPKHEDRKNYTNLGRDEDNIHNSINNMIQEGGGGIIMTKGMWL